MWVSPEVQFTQPELRQALDEPARFGDVMALIGYRLDAASSLSAPASAVELVTYWRALRTVEAEDDWVTFVHLLDATEHRDRRAWTCCTARPPAGCRATWSSRCTPFASPDDAPSGEAYLEVGVYRRRIGAAAGAGWMAQTDRRPRPAGAAADTLEAEFRRGRTRFWR